MNTIRIIIIDDHTLVRETWTYILNTDPRFKVIAGSGNAEDGVDLCKQLRPDVVLLDINLPGMNGLHAVPLIRKYAPVTKIIGVSLHTQISYAKRMMQSGASGYITKNSTREEMMKAIIEVIDGKKYICREIKNTIANNLINEENQLQNINTLSVREMEIVQLISQGLSSKEIADQKYISVKTVEVHRYNILRKLNLKNAASLVNFIHHFDFAKG
jgi:DNA-binding NarL/FixJ family response regulator